MCHRKSTRLGNYFDLVCMKDFLREDVDPGGGTVEVLHLFLVSDISSRRTILCTLFLQGQRVV